MFEPKFEKVAFTGKATAGKTTAAKYLTWARNFCKVSFADEVKHEAVAEFGLDPYLIFEDYNYKVAHRKELIDLGLSRRKFDPYYWIKKANSKILKIYKSGLYDGVVMDDLGFINEGIWAWGSGFTIVKIERQGLPDLKENIRDFEFDNWLKDNNGAYDIIINNSGTIPEFCEILAQVFSPKSKSWEQKRRKMLEFLPDMVRDQ